MCPILCRTKVVYGSWRSYAYTFCWCYCGVGKAIVNILIYIQVYNNKPHSQIDIVRQHRYKRGLRWDILKIDLCLSLVRLKAKSTMLSMIFLINDDVWKPMYKDVPSSWYKCIESIDQIAWGSRLAIDQSIWLDRRGSAHQILEEANLCNRWITWWKKCTIGSGKKMICTIQ